MEPTTCPWPRGIAVLVPVYNHQSTVGLVISHLRQLGAQVWCVDDGSSDGSGAAAAEAGAEVLTQERNQGKGLALQRGFQHLAELGWRQVCTVDADGQHPAEEALALAQASAEDASAIWVGARRMPPHSPLASRLGRGLSNFWVRVACGSWPGDAQCGLRIYPLPDTLFPRFHARRYSFEVEVLVRCRWAGIPLRHREVAVIYPEDRISHFHALRDNVRTGLVFTRLVSRRMIPIPHRQLRPSAWTWRGLLTTNSTPGGLAAAAGVGAAIGVSPIVGAQTVVLVWLCWALRLNFPMALITSNISLGPLMAGWAALGIAIGHALRWGSYAPRELFIQAREQLREAKGWAEHHEVIAPLLVDWLVGSAILMPAVALLVGAPVYFLARWLQRHSRNPPHESSE
ncbi:MAG: DUF2062 domain-containing protein [Planctomycetota bacterium]|nr:MAG: DUF2062 domain-containing protein [Planctomycetota bacterium]